MANIHLLYKDSFFSPTSHLVSSPSFLTFFISGANFHNFQIIVIAGHVGLLSLQSFVVLEANDLLKLKFLLVE